jgi:hypothetical protein
MRLQVQKEDDTDASPECFEATSLSLSHEVKRRDKQYRIDSALESFSALLVLSFTLEEHQRRGVIFSHKRRRDDVN